MRTQKVNYLVRDTALIRVHAYLCKDGNVRVFEDEIESFPTMDIALKECTIRNERVKLT